MQFLNVSNLITITTIACSHFMAWFLLLPLTFHVGRKVEGMGRPGRRRKRPLDHFKENEKFLETERGNTRSHCVDKVLEDSMDLL